jgi:hypothetical protein
MSLADTFRRILALHKSAPILYQPQQGRWSGRSAAGIFVSPERALRGAAERQLNVDLVRHRTQARRTVETRASEMVTVQNHRF